MAFRNAVASLQSGSTRLRISRRNLSRIAFPLPPLAVQLAVVDELEKQFSRLDEAVANLQRVKANLKRYKASVLKVAVEGRLVETEATLAHREGRTYETGEQLLQRILEERRGECKGRGAFPESSGATVGTADLPVGWVWTTLGQCFRVAVGATPSRKESSYWGGDISWVSSGEVQLGRIRHTDEHVSAAGLANSSTQINPAGSVMIGMIGQGKTRGQAAILDIEAANNQNCAAIWVSRAAHAGVVGPDQPTHCPGRPRTGKKKADEALRGRCDSFVVETDVHFPTDINLLLDAMRKVITLTAQWCDDLELSDWRQHAYNLRQLKRLMRTAQNKKRSKAKSPEQQEKNAALIVAAHQEYLAASQAYLDKARQTLAMIKAEGCADCIFQPIVDGISR